MQEESVFIVLGCYGRKEDGFILCPKAENRILKLDDSLVYLDEIWDYLEAVRLLDKPLIDLNAIRNVIFKMQDRFDQKIKKLWSEKEFHMIERFIHMHKACGLYIRLITDTVQPFQPEEGLELIKIQGSSIKTDIQPNMVHKTRSRR